MIAMSLVVLVFAWTSKNDRPEEKALTICLEWAQCIWHIFTYDKIKESWSEGARIEPAQKLDLNSNDWKAVQFTATFTGQWYILFYTSIEKH